MSRKQDERIEDDRFDKRYIDGDLPWDIGRPDFNLIDFVSSSQMKPCRVLDIGCGTGDSAIWLSKLGFDVTAIDSSVNAIKLARKKMAEKNVSVNFQNIDFFQLNLLEEFDFIFDRGCFHSFGKIQREEFSKKASSLLVKNGIWLSIIGSMDDGFREMGPPQLSCLEVVSAIETNFEIINITSKYFDTNLKVIPKAWILLAKKRTEINS